MKKKKLGTFKSGLNFYLLIVKNLDKLMLKSLTFSLMHSITACASASLSHQNKLSDDQKSETIKKMRNFSSSFSFNLIKNKVFSFHASTHDS